MQECREAVAQIEEEKKQREKENAMRRKHRGR
jgi:hypothetical protein